MHTIDFFIADVHGYSDLLINLMSFLQRHASMRDARPRYTFLGDLIDRGPDSRGCMEIAMETVAQHEGSVILLGNHEHMMVDAIDTDGKSELSGTWALNGAFDTIESYIGANDIRHFLSRFESEFTLHLNALRRAPLHIERGGLLAVHAGIDPCLDFSQQGVKVLSWIRWPFLDNVDPRTRPVIHGHSVIGSRPVVTENRISIDTGSYGNGLLTACILDHDTWEISFAQANEVSARYVDPIRMDRGYGTLLDDPRRIFDPEYVPTFDVNSVAAASSPSTAR